jgi:hypothetical protein
MMPIIGTSAEVHYGVNGNAVLLWFPTIIK